MPSVSIPHPLNVNSPEKNNFFSSINSFTLDLDSVTIRTAKNFDTHIVLLYCNISSRIFHE